METPQPGPKYRIVGHLGEGAMGVVYRALHVTLGREVAIKFLAEDVLQSLPEAGRRFLREVQACVALTHPNIIKIIDVGEAQGRPFFVMELLKAKDLASVFSSRRALPADLGISILDQMLDALDYCHRKGFLHRDIKPANIMLEESGRAVLMDFGVVKAMERTVLTEAGKLLGTPYYLAPEVLRGAAQTVTSDLWSLGVTVWEGLAGRLLWEGDDLNQILTNICLQQIPSIRSIRAELSEEVGLVVDRLIERDLTRRWPSASVARRALSKALGVERPATRPSGPAARISSGAHALSRPRATRPSGTLAIQRSVPVEARPRPWRAMGAVLLGLTFVGAIASHLARPGRERAAPTPILRNVRFAYPDVDRLRVEFATDLPRRCSLRVSDSTSPVEATPVTTHCLEVSIAPMDTLTDALVLCEGAAAASVGLPPPTPGVLARRLTQAVSDAVFTDEAVRRAFASLSHALSRRKKPVGNRLAKVLPEYPAEVAKIEALVYRLKSQNGLCETYDALRPDLGKVLASAAITAAVRYALLGALDRLNLADALLKQLGRRPRFFVVQATQPAVSLSVAPGEMIDQAVMAEHLDSAEPLAEPSHVSGRPIDAPPTSLREPSIENVFPPRGGTYFWLVPPGITRFGEAEQLRGMIDGAASGGEWGASLAFVTTRVPGVRGQRVHLRTLQITPGVALVLKPPFAPGSIVLRRPLEGYDPKIARVWHTLTLRGAMVPPQGKWTLELRTSFMPGLFPNLKIERIGVEALP